MRPFIGTVQKPIPGDWQLTIPPAVNNNTPEFLHIRLPSLQVILFTVTRKFFAVYQFVPRHSSGSFPVSFRVTNFYALTILSASIIILPVRI